MSHAEFTGWRKSLRSNSSGNCVEVATGWCKSRRSNDSGNCVEVVAADRLVAVRDSKDHGRGPVLEFAAADWEAFTAAVRNGEFDL
jgi:hypothetical protein